MNMSVILLLVAILLCVVGVWRSVGTYAEVSTKKFLLLEVAMGDITGRQMRLADEYRDVHAILKQIRDLNKEELQDRKEILQHENLSSSNRVIQTRSFLAQLEAAAQAELDGFRKGR